ncbi:FAS-associated factor 2 [Diabrotica virgifera virgifera]|uniref:FAS-associated factor 2 n=1 Tax=Diabrotica virgifera virgifera TaxID=50390 RepID=A0A6P7GEB6_DIAVI|nr:FAS-associated factor 2 [Diabrotica virgifera virgifera]
MNYLRDNGSMGLTSEQTEKVLQLQDLTGIEDITICRDVLQRHQWNLEVAVQEQLNIREGRPSMYATETRPPAVVSDHLGQHIFYTPPTDGSGSGVRGLFKTVFNFMFNMCYNTLITLLQLGRRLLRIQDTRRPNYLQDVMDFIRVYEEKYPRIHPVFYQGTFSQVLNDTKRELRFLLVYLHDSKAPDTDKFCNRTLADQEIIRYVNQNFLFWGCSAYSDEGTKTAAAVRASSYPFLAVLVLKDNKMTIVGRLEGFTDAILLKQRLTNIVSEYEINLLSARADRLEASINRSLRFQQDEAFEESLRADQEKERRREQERRAKEEELRKVEEEKLAEQARRESLAQEKINSLQRVPPEPEASHPDAVHVVFKLPCGSRLERRFLKSHSLESVFYFVFCHPNAPDSFEITTNFPKRVLDCRQESQDIILTLEQAGLKNREVLFINDLDA